MFAQLYGFTYSYPIIIFNHIHLTHRGDLTGNTTPDRVDLWLMAKNGNLTLARDQELEPHHQKSLLFERTPFYRRYSRHYLKSCLLTVGRIFLSATDPMLYEDQLQSLSYLPTPPLGKDMTQGQFLMPQGHLSCKSAEGCRMDRLKYYGSNKKELDQEFKY